MSVYPSQVLEETEFKDLILDEMDKIKEKRGNMPVIKGCEDADKILDELLALVETNIELLENYQENQSAFDEALDNNFRITELFMDFEEFAEASGVALNKSSIRRMNGLTRTYVDGQRGNRVKKLIVINGTMGVGKTTTCHELNKRLSRSVMLDGDWCWHMDPFIVNDETKEMVESNIVHLINSYLDCSHLDHIVFCWVIPYESILEHLRKRLVGDYELTFISLVCSEDALTSRLEKDVLEGKRSSDIIEKSLDRLKLYENMSSNKIDISHLDTDELVSRIIKLIE